MRRGSDLNYFTHEVGGRVYGGWYRLSANRSIELYARGQIRKAKLGRLSPEKRANRMLEEIVHTLEKVEARPKPD